MAQNRSNFADAYREIYEKLKPSDGADAYVKDFKKSDAPQFKGKSDEKKQDMAIAAYLDDKDKSKKEEIDIEAETKYELEEATMVSDISGISIPNLKKAAKKKNIKVSRVTPGGPMGAEYEVTFSGSEKDLMSYAKEHLGFEGRNFKDLQKHLNMGEQLEENPALMAIGRTAAAAVGTAVGNKIGDKITSQKKHKEIEENKVFVVRYTDPQNKKRFAIPYKDQKSADDKADQLRKNFKGYGQKAVKSIEVTKDVLKPGVKWKRTESVDEGVELDEAKFAVKLSFLPKPIYVDSESAGKVKMQMRKALKKPEDIESVERVMPADYKSDLRNRIKGKKDDEDGEEKTEATDKQKRLQRAKDMNKFYDAQKKAALKGKNKKLAKKMLKNELDEAKFDEPEFSKKNFAFNRIGLVAKDLKKKELGKVTDEGRKSKYDMDQDDEEGANKNIIMQLRKSVDLKGRFDVTFEDGKKVKVKDTIARAAVLKHAGFRRPAEKLAFQQKIEKSYRDLLNALKGR